MGNRQPPIERILRLFEVTPEGCWHWTGHKNNKGYGTLDVYQQGRWANVYAHRWLYEYYNGPIPEGLELDHLCRNPICINPDHMEPVTHRENVLRGIHPHVIAHSKGECTKGHKILDDALYRNDGTPYCHICSIERHRRRAEQKRRQGAMA